MGTLYNPNGLTTNCGFCAIAHGLFRQGTNTDADKLYLQTLDRLGIQRQGASDPIPRQLIFPDPLIDGVPLPTGYQALADSGHGPCSYTITAVACDHNLRYDLNNRDLALPRQFFEFYARTGTGKWDIADFVDMRLNWLQSQGRKPAADAVRGATSWSSWAGTPLSAPKPQITSSMSRWTGQVISKRSMRRMGVFTTVRAFKAGFVQSTC